MDRAAASHPDLLAHYEGLVRKTAGMIAPLVEEEYDDIMQGLRIKVWQALLAFDPSKARQTRDAYVFMCVRNRVKDFQKKVRRNELFIEDIAPDSEEGFGTGSIRRDHFEARYFAAAEDQVFGLVAEGTPLVPSTLDSRERRIVVYLYLDFAQAEIAEAMEMSRKEVSTVVRGIREKMADWRPGVGERPVVPLAA